MRARVALDEAESSAAAGFYLNSVAHRNRWIELNVAAVHRSGRLAPFLFLHRFGSTKEDYADIVRCVEFAKRSFLAYDAPGRGETSCSDLSELSVPLLLKTALRVLEQFGIDHVISLDIRWAG
jgi:hypothetical protein